MADVPAVDAADKPTEQDQAVSIVRTMLDAWSMGEPNPIFKEYPNVKNFADSDWIGRSVLLRFEIKGVREAKGTAYRSKVVTILHFQSAAGEGLVEQRAYHVARGGDGGSWIISRAR